MCAERIDAIANRFDRIRSGTGVMLGEKSEQTFDVAERVLRIDYLRHGFGFAAFGFFTSLVIQA